MDSLGSSGPGRTYGHGLLALRARDFGQARTLMEQAAHDYAAAGHVAGEAASLLAVGIILRLHDGERQAEAALPPLERSRELCRQLEDPGGVARAVSEIGKVQLALKEPATALELQYEALSLRQSARDIRGQAQSWQEIGRTFDKDGRPREAVEAMERALELWPQTGDRVNQYATLLSMALINWNQGDRDRAIDCARQAADAVDSLGDVGRRAQADTRVGQWLGELGRDAEALPVLRRVVETHEGLPRASKHPALSRRSRCRPAPAPQGRRALDRGEASSDEARRAE
jgi:tetratricopeptide (TPR) repeat protein